ncbi:MAG: metallophosphoesterase [Clostridiales bacterium]|nr:metallophosphoesterase [Clostridiales bacterium]
MNEETVKNEECVDLPASDFEAAQGKAGKSGKKGKRGKKALMVFIIILAVIVAFTGVTTCITAIGLSSNLKKAQSFPAAETNELTLENYSNGCWNIYTDGELKILQLTDVHLGGGWLSLNKDGMALNAVAAMISAEQPDLVIVTGDIAYPVPFQSGTFNNKSGAKLFATLMETLGVYWTMTFGNHDTEAYSYYDREEITEFYSSGDYPHCLLQAGPSEVDGCGNQVINIVNSDGVITRSLILIDSHSYIDSDKLGIQAKYDNIHDNQIAWYKNTVAELNEKNEKTFATITAERATAYAAEFSTVPTSVFMHIPLAEYYDAWKEYEDNGYEDTDNVTFNYGTYGEMVCYGVGEDEMFETLVELGSTDTVFCGHDHYNNYSVTYKGIDLTYGMSVDYLAYFGIYKKGSQRGCTVITYSPDGSISYEAQNYYQEKYSSYYEKETVEFDY